MCLGLSIYCRNLLKADFVELIAKKQKITGMVLTKKEEITWGHRAIILDSEKNRIALYESA